MPQSIHVVAGILFDSRGRVLIAQRQAGTHMAGRWEFPGGKLRPDESRRDGLLRELKEELGIAVSQCSPLIRLRHSYPEKEVLLDFWVVQQFDGQATGVEGQAIKWLYINELSQADILEADKPVIDALRLPDHYAIKAGSQTGGAVPDLRIERPDELAQEFSAEYEKLIAQIRSIAVTGTRLIQLSVPGISKNNLQKLTIASMQAAPSVNFLINGDPDIAIPIAQATGAAGIHLPSRFLSQFSANKLSNDLLIGASCHTHDELSLATRLGVHFAVLGPVLSTASHLDGVPLGWDRFAAIVELATIPVYALGGVGSDSIGQAQSLGAQGVADLF